MKPTTPSVSQKKFSASSKLRPNSNSIIGRLLIASFILLPLVCGLLGLSLDKAFTASIKTNEQEQLMLQAYALIAAAEYDNGQLWLPEQLTEDKLNQASSGLFAIVHSARSNKIIWQSPSAINKPLPIAWKPKPLAAGKRSFLEERFNDEPYYLLQYSVIWETSDNQTDAFQFVIFHHQKTTQQQILSYRKNLWSWLAGITLVIIFIQIAILKWGLKPLQQLAIDLAEIQQGKETQLEGNYPLELHEMTDAINALLETETAQRQRYKESLADLAHSLKTPLAIMQGSISELSHKATNVPTRELEAQTNISEQISRIDQLISYQLKRSINAPQNPFAELVNVKTQCEKIISALNKVYRDQACDTQVNIAPSINFKGDEGDLQEILGNLLDNAYKYGNGKITIHAQQTGETGLRLTIEDNGPGMPDDQADVLLKRGERADTSISGQGIGLAIVSDIISHYKGSLKIARSGLGGLAVIIQL